MKVIKNKILIIVLIVTISTIAICGLVTAFILNYNVSAPPKIEILDDGSNIYLTTKMNDNYDKYKFIFKSIEGQIEIEIETENNILSIDELQRNGLKLGETYKITSQYISENKGNNSQVSKPIEWTAYDYLDIPLIDLNEKENILFWEEIDNADYYILYVNGKDFEQTFILEENTFNLNQLKGDNYKFYVSAFSDLDYYKTSPNGEILTYEYVKYFLPLEEVTFDNLDKKLYCIGSEKLDILNIEINGTSYLYKNFIVTEEENKYIYTVDLKIFQEILQIGASPATVDDYNIYNGEITYTK